MNALHFAVSMDTIAPGISSWLLEQVKDEHRDGRGSEEVVEGTLVYRLITVYEGRTLGTYKPAVPVNYRK